MATYTGKNRRAEDKNTHDQTRNFWLSGREYVLERYGWPSRLERDELYRRLEERGKGSRDGGVSRYLIKKGQERLESARMEGGE